MNAVFSIQESAGKSKKVQMNWKLEDVSKRNLKKNTTCCIISSEQTRQQVIPEVFDNLTHFEPTLLTKGFLYLPADVRPPSSGRQKPACGCPPSFARSRKRGERRFGILLTGCHVCDSLFFARKVMSIPSSKTHIFNIYYQELV